MHTMKRIIDGFEKNPTEYEFHLDGAIFAVVNIFKNIDLFIFDIAEIYPFGGVCYQPDYFDDLVILLGKTRRVHIRLEIFR